MKNETFGSPIDEYLTWLRSGLSIKELDSCAELTTPFLDRHNDHLQLYLIDRGDKKYLSDDGYILNDLKISGFKSDSQKRKQILKTTLAGFGVTENEGCLEIAASKENLGRSIHMLLQAMLSINDMFVLTSPYVKSLFWEDVQGFLDMHDIRYTSRVKFSGLSGLDHEIDFLIPKSKNEPTRAIKVINNPDRDKVGLCLFAFNDIKSMRNDEIKPFACINDLSRSFSSNDTEAFSNYDIVPMLWSKREDLIPLLAG